ncbi:hypothetical protein Acsp04_46080 [Actinomadura sp. NBRC 104425]|uniref:DUF397 domain-containing protein n=1 Tax=Actinomadura sp. NBRC 104425 TaxID=3032204 RepID=UPI0024A5D174|nr:hypothetical protein Acsp04_46080 [Actinomadura sp. NBRC 104425]
MVGQREWNQASWRKSRRSDSPGGCVCLSVIGSWAAIRDSKNPQPVTLVMPRSALRGLIQEIKRGAWDLR